MVVDDNVDKEVCDECQKKWNVLHFIHQTRTLTVGDFSINKFTTVGVIVVSSVYFLD